jgi:hypothetical protein
MVHGDGYHRWGYNIRVDCKELDCEDVVQIEMK